jgi:hypothetical protein
VGLEAIERHIDSWCLPEFSPHGLDSNMEEEDMTGRLFCEGFGNAGATLGMTCHVYHDGDPQDRKARTRKFQSQPL